MPSASKNALAWKKYLVAKRLRLDGTSYEIDAEDLGRLTGREPRLLAKFDTADQVPDELRAPGYSLLPIRNGRYLLFRGDIFARLPSPPKAVAFIPTLEFPLQTAGRSSGEMQYLDYAFNTGLLSHFVGAGRLYLTIRGREYTDAFQFFIGEQAVKVESVQIEVDGGYEGERDVVLVEAKIARHDCLNIRQLYYPYRRFASLVKGKRIRPVFLQFDLLTATYTFHEFAFRDEEKFDSQSVVSSASFTIDAISKLRLDALVDVAFETTNDVVPQADVLNRILELLNGIEAGCEDADAVADLFGFDQRQSYYYAEAAEYLGVVARRDGRFCLTDHGVRLLSETPSGQRVYLAKLLVNSWIFRSLVMTARRKGHFGVADIDGVIAGVRSAPGEARYGGTTVPRRRQTLLAWARWLAEHIGCLREDDEEFYLS